MTLKISRTALLTMTGILKKMIKTSREGTIEKYTTMMGRLKNNSGGSDACKENADITKKDSLRTGKLLFYSASSLRGLVTWLEHVQTS